MLSLKNNFFVVLGIFVHGCDEEEKNLWRFSLQNKVISKWAYISHERKLFQEQFLQQPSFFILAFFSIKNSQTYRKQL